MVLCRRVHWKNSSRQSGAATTVCNLYESLKCLPTLRHLGLELR